LHVILGCFTERFIKLAPERSDHLGKGDSSSEWLKSGETTVSTALCASAVASRVSPAAAGSNGFVPIPQCPCYFELSNGPRLDSLVSALDSLARTSSKRRARMPSQDEQAGNVDAPGARQIGSDKGQRV
ncbi:MAG: hypothetical protein OER43_13445, partial [Gammaproteobacteria bacterium]|nr:hypothetical protein [Gammaproteobacteria bacterium]